MSKELPIEINIKPTDEEPTQDAFNNFEVDYVDANTDYAEFYARYMLRNLPCVIKNVSTNWRCSKEWIMENRINCEYLVQKYGELEAPVSNCSEIDYRVPNQCTMKVKDYMRYLNNQEKELMDDKKLLYLKDWHLKRLTNDIFYEVPILFASDWLNEYALDTKEDDFMFVYIGPKHTWTAFHADVYSSYSWSVNVTGRKKWQLLPPGEELKLKDSLGNFPVLLDPNVHKNVKYIEIIQEKGDGIFVPSGWYHQVFNLLDTVSVNHNFVNACNIEHVCCTLQEGLQCVEKEIEEFRDTPEFSSQCQLMLKSDFGMNFDSFTKFIIHIAQKRLNYLDGNTYKLFDTYKLQKNHIIFDLYKIIKVINILENHHIKSNVILESLFHQLLNIKCSINKVLL